MRSSSVPSRRFSSRVQVTEDVWVYWKCEGRDDISKVCNVSMGGLFIETLHARPSGTLTRLDFLVAEGQIRADAIVRHSREGAGLGLKFRALTEQDRPKLAALVTRLRRAQHVLGPG